MLPLRYASLPLFYVAAAACGGGTTSATGPTPDAHAPVQEAALADVGDNGHDAGQPAHEGGTSTPDDAAMEAGSTGSADGSRNATCTPLTQQTGTVIDSEHGRLDGTLVYVVQVGQGAECNGDSSHVHLQIDVSGNVYDVAVDIGTAPNDEDGVIMQSMAVPGGVWSEGWHATDTLSYPTLGIHSTAIAIAAPTSVAATVENALANVSKISIFCTGYKQENGCHDVHYEDGTGKDGMIVLNPTEATSEVLLFRFADQTF